MQQRGRHIATFTDRDNKMPMSLKDTDNTGKYSLRKGTGLKMRKRCRGRKSKLVI